mmetsp:Transcript_8217/g.21161  ORF Transcript_8217/g.21161 Transcript_8217/m.21161 type:complete len:503 (-) Transcript_8217:275-1783(-)
MLPKQVQDAEHALIRWWEVVILVHVNIHNPEKLMHVLDEDVPGRKRIPILSHLERRFSNDATIKLGHSLEELDQGILVMVGERGRHTRVKKGNVRSRHHILIPEEPSLETSPHARLLESDENVARVQVCMDEVVHQKHLEHAIQAHLGKSGVPGVLFFEHVSECVAVLEGLHQHIAGDVRVQWLWEADVPVALEVLVEPVQVFSLLLEVQLLEDGALELVHTLGDEQRVPIFRGHVSETQQDVEVLKEPILDSRVADLHRNRDSCLHVDSLSPTGRQFGLVHLCDASRGAWTLVKNFEHVFEGLPESLLYRAPRVVKLVGRDAHLKFRHLSAEGRWEEIPTCGCPLTPLDERRSCDFQRFPDENSPLLLEDPEVQDHWGQRYCWHEQEPQEQTPKCQPQPFSQIVYISSDLPPQPFVLIHGHSKFWICEPRRTITASFPLSSQAQQNGQAAHHCLPFRSATESAEHVYVSSIHRCPGLFVPSPSIAPLRHLLGPNQVPDEGL